MVDPIISAVVEDLASMLLSSIKEEVKLVTVVNDEVKKLVSNFNIIQGLLDDAEEHQLTEDSVKKWLFDVKAVSYDMDDVLDEWKTWIQTSQLQHQHHSSGSNQIQLKHKVLSIFRCICFTKRDVGLCQVVAEKIRKIQQRLDGIATDKVTYQLNPSFSDTQKVKGRDVEKDEVKSKIFEAKSNPHIISLVGLEGIGKTTLAQLVYDDSEIEAHFEKKIWVRVSEPFDEMQIAKSILESLCDSSAHDFKELANVLKEISASLNKKKFLLVLDDVRKENRETWEEVEKIFKCGLLGSTILITTRNERVAIVMGCKPENIHKVRLLTSEECWSIIRQITHFQSHYENLKIGRIIAYKCKGLPLVATTIGGLLRFKTSVREWVRVLEKMEGESEDILKKMERESEDILSPLKLSYYDLPLPLKQCFSYCAVFPKDFKIEKRRLIGMWMAQDYLKGKEEDENLEIVGETYFENLIARSLFQTQSNNGNVCMVNDMVISQAQTFMKNECLMIEVPNDIELNENSLYADASVRHLTLMIKNDALFPRYIYNFTKLRSLIIQLHGYRSALTIDALKNIFDHLTCIRTLDLSSCDIEEIPSLINRLVHLRWLDLSANTNLKKLPETLCECYNLQALTLNGCWNLVKLPKRIGKLINLMYLSIEQCSKIKCLPKGIKNLWRLRDLTVFIIRVNESKSFSIVEMEKLNNLRGRLEIRGLGNVRKVEEARKAQLKEKKRVTELSLSFDGDHVQEFEEELLEALEPPLDLEILSIKEYKGKTLFPSWMMTLNLLRKLTIINFGYREELPPMGKLLCLEELYLENMGVKRVGVDFMGIEKEKDVSTSFLSFPKLKILRFYEFTEWEEWDDIDEWLMERINNKTITVIPCLQELTLFFCPKLKTLPYHLLSPPITTRLQKLNIRFCNVLEQEVQKDKLSHIPDLAIGQGSLTIRGLGHKRKREEVRKSQLMKKKNIIDLSLIFDVEEDEEETAEGDNGMKDEEELLEALEPPSDLEILSIREYKGKMLFPSWMMKLNLLRKLEIRRCENCEELPPLGKLSCLEELDLYDISVKRVGVEFMVIEKEKDASTSFLSFPKLKILRFQEFREWEEWDDIDEWLMERINNKTVTVMPCLQELSIESCRKLKTLPYHLLSPTITPRVQKLNIHLCDVLETEIQKDKLSHIPDLAIVRGRLTIRGLGHVRKLEKARKAQLMKRKNVIYLSLIFNVEEDEEEIVEGDNWMQDEEELHEALEPPSDLEELSLEEYKGKTLFSSWMMKLNLLRKLTIYRSENCEELPPLGKLSCLEQIYLYDMEVKKVGIEFMGIEKEKDPSPSFVSFPKLKKLSFELFWEWEKWDDVDERSMKTITIMPCLQKLTLYFCPKLKTLSPKWMMKLNVLRVLTISKCRNCEELPSLGKLPCLEELYLKNMEVKRVGVEFMGIEKEKDASTSFLSFPKLKVLSFELFWEWEEWDDIDKWLMERIYNKTIIIMPCLQELSINRCQMLKTLPYHLLSPPITTKLQELYIARCDVLQQEVHKDKLSHIPHLTIIARGLRIRGLGHVRKLQEARNQLMREKNVIGLSLIFNVEEDEEETFEGDNGMKDEEELLKALEPPSDLEELSIKEYKGKTLFPSWMMKLNLLRKLVIRRCVNCEELPPLGKLSCLEELKLFDMRVKRVGVEFMGIEKEKDTPISFLSFPKLKILRFQEFTEWEEWDDMWLTETIKVMPCLQELSIYKCQKLKTLPYHLLSPPITTRIQELYINGCVVLEAEVQKDKLSHIPHLRIRPGSLTIRGLGHVRKREEARKAQLMKKKNVIYLSLIFDVEEDEEETVEGDNVQEDEEELLEALKPPSDLKILSIREYKGKTFPSWMMQLNLLEKLTIYNSRNCEELPPLGKLSCLKELCLYRMGVKRVGVEFMGIEKEKDASTSSLSFPKLEILRIEEFTEWEEWDDIDKWLTERINKPITIMPSLQVLFIYFCPKLKTLPYYLLSPSVTTRLQELVICECDVLQQEAQKAKLSHIPHLTIQPGLRITGLGHVRKLEEARNQLMKEKKVTNLSLIFDVEDDEEEIVEGDNWMKDEEELLEALEPRSDLEELSIEEYKGKTLFPSWMMKLNLLRKLKIYRCENCEELPLLGKLLCLEELELFFVGVKKVGVEFMGIEKEKDPSPSFVSFPKLKKLSFELFWEWEKWDDVDEGSMKTITIMPYLQKLTLYFCPKLKTLSPKWMMKLNVLRVLTISKCKNCEELPPLGKLPCLEELYLKNMEVKRVGVEFMGIEKEKDASTSFLSFPKLKILEFEEFWEWEEWDDINEWLMERINKTITIMPCLQQVIIDTCPKLKTLPYYLLSPPNAIRLQELDITRCDVLQQKIQKDKLPHISRLNIGLEKKYRDVSNPIRIVSQSMSEEEEEEGGGEEEAQ